MTEPTVAKSNPNIVICDDADVLYREAAQRWLKAAREAVAARGIFTIALSGGNTPKSLFSLIATDEWKKRFPWEKTHIFWGDERFVPHDDPRSNYRMAGEALLSHLNIAQENIHSIPTDTDTAEAAASAYEQTVRQICGISTGEVPRLDFNLLGLGENGHTASLFPGSPLLQEKQRLVAADYVEEVRMWRVTMTLPLINHSRLIAFLVAGASKAQIVSEVVPVDAPVKHPAQLVRAEGGSLLWLLDRPAAGKLSG